MRFFMVAVSTVVLTVAGWAGYERTHAPDETIVEVAGSSTVRGYLFRVGRDGQAYPAPWIATQLTHPSYGRSPFAYSGADGMYALPNVPPGQFVLEVWLTNQQKDALRFAVTVRGEPLVNVPPIRVP